MHTLTATIACLLAKANASTDDIEAAGEQLNDAMDSTSQLTDLMGLANASLAPDMNYNRESFLEYAGPIDEKLAQIQGRVAEAVAAVERLALADAKYTQAADSVNEARAGIVAVKGLVDTLKSIDIWELPHVNFYQLSDEVGYDAAEQSELDRQINFTREKDSSVSFFRENSVEFADRILDNLTQAVCQIAGAPTEDGVALAQVECPICTSSKPAATGCKCRTCRFIACEDCVRTAGPTCMACRKVGHFISPVSTAQAAVRGHQARELLRKPAVPASAGGD